MRGSIIKRGRSSYTIALNLGTDPQTGKRKQQWVTVKGTKKDAEKRLSELLHQLDTGTFMKPTKATLAEYLERWLKGYAWTNLAPRTAEGYEHIIRRHFIPALGDMTLTQLKPEHLQRYYSEKLRSGRCDSSGGLSTQTVRHHHTALHKALETALEWGLLSRNPADHASLMLKQGVHPKIVQERLGHASIQITLDTYSHVAPGLQQVAAERFDEAFGTKYNEPENEAIEKIR